ncbi:hypothetical protein STEG23_018498 [Scotinomys teguina]
MEMDDPNNPGQRAGYHQALTIKELKGLKEASAAYGALAPFTLTMVESYQMLRDPCGSQSTVCPVDVPADTEDHEDDPDSTNIGTGAMDVGPFKVSFSKFLNIIGFQILKNDTFILRLKCYPQRTNIIFEKLNMKPINMHSLLSIVICLLEDLENDYMYEKSLHGAT